MHSTKSLIAFIAVMASVTFFTRSAALLLPERVANSSAVQNANRTLPPAILTLLVMYSIQDVFLSSATSRAPELISVLTVVLIHVWKRNALLSIFSGTFLFMFLKQSGQLGRMG